MTTTPTKRAPRLLVDLGNGEFYVMDPSFFLHDKANFSEKEKEAVRQLCRDYDPDENYIAQVQFLTDKVGTMKTSLFDSELVDPGLADFYDNGSVHVPQGLTSQQIRDLWASCKA